MAAHATLAAGWRMSASARRIDEGSGNGQWSRAYGDARDEGLADGRMAARAWSMGSWIGCRERGQRDREIGSRGREGREREGAGADRAIGRVLR